MKTKSPILASVLNFFLFGAGTIYNGRRTAVGVLMIIGGNLAQGVEIKVSPLADNSVPHQWPFLISAMVVLKIACAIDGYQEAKRGS